MFTATDQIDPTLAVSLQNGKDGTAIVVRTANDLPSLSTLLPALHNMGVQVSRQEQASRDDKCCLLWLEADSGRRVAAVADPAAFCEFLKRMFSGEIEDGRMNGLALVAGCSAQEVLLVRAAASYLRQAGLHLSLRYIAERLRQHPAALRSWLALFVARFDPALGDQRPARLAAAGAAVDEALAGIQDADAFLVFSWLRELVHGIVRSNYFRFAETGPLPPYLAFKVDGSALSFLPAPRPYRETFVFSERFEGVHLRGGPVARGGLRWSDRREDYRTEVLGLVKAQLVKNAVIVPTGAKGGFVCKALAPDVSREAMAREGREVYRLFINGLLDLTDNQGSDGSVVPPSGVVCHDAADPYLVVAADKGTATFSDLANEIAAQRGFWLGDAFASGGSVGYDHKKLAITAKGAWETAKIHFAEEGIDWANEGFTAVGIGDMSGDVFGNGSLLMPRMRLIAAFDHRHIFIDPQPATEAAFKERSRLFQLARSSWDDYDRKLISPGGGVWSRAERHIKLSPQARDALGVQAEELSPDALIKAILRAPVTVLYNGGIGTYLKASHESTEAARDRSNDRTRIDASQLRARLVVEGGNLGLTQAARVELAQRGVRVYTDAVDNSGGVDCSDHEVNIKIALGLDPVAEQERAKILAELSGVVVESVLATNREQARRIARHVQYPRSLPDPKALLDSLGERTGLDRALEGLPDDDTLAARAGQGLLSPEVAVVMAHSKMALKADWMAHAPAETAPWHQAVLLQYFPAPLRRLPLQRHPLGRQIVATSLANDAVNRMGIGVAERIAGEHRCAVAAVLDAFAFATTALRIDGRTLGDAILVRLPSPERHEREEEIERVLAEMVSLVLASPDLRTQVLWEALRSMPGDSPGETASADEVIAGLRGRFALLSHLHRALPLLARGLAVPAAVGLLAKVEEQTGLNRLADGLLERTEFEHSALFARWIQDRLALLSLRVAAAAHALQAGGRAAAATAVDQALQRLGWLQAIATLRLVHKSEYGQRRLERIVGIVSRLDEEWVLERVGIHAAA